MLIFWKNLRSYQMDDPKISLIYFAVLVKQCGDILVILLELDLGVAFHMETSHLI